MAEDEIIQGANPAAYKVENNVSCILIWIVKGNVRGVNHTSNISNVP